MAENSKEFLNPSPHLCLPHKNPTYFQFYLTQSLAASMTVYESDIIVLTKEGNYCFDVKSGEPSVPEINGIEKF